MVDQGSVDTVGESVQMMDEPSTEKIVVHGAEDIVDIVEDVEVVDQGSVDFVEDVEVVDQGSVDIVEASVQMRSDEQDANIFVEDAIANVEEQATDFVLEHAGDCVEEQAADNAEEQPNHIQDVDNVVEQPTDNVDGVDADVDDGLLENFTDPDYEQNEEEHGDNDDDNTFFRLSEGFYIGGDTGNVQDNEEREGSDAGTDYLDSDDLRSLPSDEEDGGSSIRYKKDSWFNPATDMEDPKFKIGMKFDNVKILRSAIIQYSVKNARDIHYVKNEGRRVRVRCQDGCPWELYAYEQADKSLRINTFRDEHTCTMVWQNKKVHTGYLADKYLRKFRSDPKMSMGSFIETVKEDCMYEISKHQFYRTRAKCAEVVNGIVAEQYKILWDYGEELKRTNPGSTIQLEEEDNTFKRIYICLGACKEGFKAGCRHVIGLDGCFLKTGQGGQLLAAVGIDADNCMFPLAWAVVDTENRTNWTWFLEMLVVDVGMHNPREWTFISDKQKGLVESINTVCEGAEHRCCARHLYSNFTLSHKGLTLKTMFWAAARATTVPEWRTVMNDIKDASEEAFKWFSEKPASQWSRSHFQEHSKCDILLNNLCEAFNSSILVAREKPIISMLEKIRHQQMLRMNAKREATKRWDKPFGPRIMKIIERAKSDARYLKADYAGPEKFEVSNRDGMKWSVNLIKCECACRRWQLTGIPCQHAIAGMLSRNIGILDYVELCYWRTSYLRSYTPVIQPISGPELWQELGKRPLIPPEKKKQAGRPKKLRKRSQNEPPAGVKMGRSGMKMTCKKCGDIGHNMRTCKANLPADQPSQSQPSQSQPSQQKKRSSTSTKIPAGKKKSKGKDTN